MLRMLDWAIWQGATTIRSMNQSLLSVSVVVTKGASHRLTSSVEVMMEVMLEVGMVKVKWTLWRLAKWGKVEGP